MKRRIVGLAVAAAVVSGGWFSFGTGTVSAGPCPHAAQVPGDVNDLVEEAIWGGISRNNASIPLRPKLTALLFDNVPNCP